MASIGTTDGRRIFYDDQGSGSALLLIGRRIVSRRGWEPQVPTFARSSAPPLLLRARPERHAPVTEQECGNRITYAGTVRSRVRP